jgi:predicted nucleic acid-binding protein
MIVAVDTSVLLAIFNREPDAEAWLERLAHCARHGMLVISEVVFAELSAVFPHRARLDAILEALFIEVLPSTRDTLFEAGRMFARFRKAGGTRAVMVPDFLIGAHALKQADQLATNDRGYLRAHFGELKVLGLSTSK